MVGMAKSAAGIILFSLLGSLNGNLSGSGLMKAGWYSSCFAQGLILTRSGTRHSKTAIWKTGGIMLGLTLWDVLTWVRSTHGCDFINLCALQALLIRAVAFL
jgi:hypothetical protein